MGRIRIAGTYIFTNYMTWSTIRSIRCERAIAAAPKHITISTPEQWAYYCEHNGANLPDEYKASINDLLEEIEEGKLTVRALERVKAAGEVIDMVVRIGEVREVEKEEAEKR